jgi:GNAT superfamily N-acetyltransferase
MRPEPTGVRFRRMTRADIPEAMGLKEAAGWNQTAADWERFLTANPEGCFAAESADRLVGTSTTVVYQDRLAWIGMVLVDRAHRGNGIGTTLLKRALQHLDGRGIACAKLDATPQGKPLYQELGFVGEYEIERWELKRSAAARPAVTAAPVPGSNLESILPLDREILGADRGWLLRSLTQTAPEFTLLAKQDGEIAGYALGRHGSLADHLGPWTARTPDAAATLLDEFLKQSTRERVFVDCIRANRWALALVQARGFAFSRPLTRMFRGNNQHAGQTELLCATLGPEFG